MLTLQYISDYISSLNKPSVLMVERFDNPDR